MDLLSLLIALIVIGVALYIVNLIPMEATIKRIITIVAIALVCIWALRILLGGGPIVLGR